MVWSGALTKVLREKCPAGLSEQSGQGLAKLSIQTGSLWKLQVSTITDTVFKHNICNKCHGLLKLAKSNRNADKTKSCFILMGTGVGVDMENKRRQAGMQAVRQDMADMQAAKHNSQ